MDMGGPRWSQKRRNPDNLGVTFKSYSGTQRTKNDPPGRPSLTWTNKQAWVLSVRICNIFWLFWIRRDAFSGGRSYAIGNGSAKRFGRQQQKIKVGASWGGDYVIKANQRRRKNFPCSLLIFMQWRKDFIIKEAQMVILSLNGGRKK